MATFSWYSMVVFCLVYPQVADSAEVNLGFNTSHQWYGTAYQYGSGKNWTPDKSGFVTTISHSDGTESWLITKNVKYGSISTQIYLDIKARPTDCKNDTPTCELHIYAYYGTNLGFGGRPDKKVLENKLHLLNQTEFKRNSTSTRTISVNHTGPDILFAIKVRESDWTIYQIKMYYYYCEGAIINNIQLNKTYPYQNVTASCSAKAKRTDNQTLFTVRCQQNGEWEELSNVSQCFCDKGFQPSGSNGCLQCPQHHYKAGVSNTNCRRCRNNNTNNSDFTVCKCIKDHYYDHQGGPCYGLPSKVRQLKVVKNSEESVNVTWLDPLDNGGFGGPLLFDVNCHYCEGTVGSDCSTNCRGAEYSSGPHNITTRFVIISKLEPGYLYSFTVYSKLGISQHVPNEKWKSNKTDFKLEKNEPLKENEKRKGKKLFIFVGAAGGVLLLLLLTLIVIVVRTRRNKSRSKDGVQNGGFLIPELGQKMYIDPANYDDPEAAVKEFANEIDPKNLNLERVIGGGEFGDVYRGKLTCSDGTLIEVAAKTLKHDSDERSRRDFFLEASAMGQFKDPNVVNLEGVITKTFHEKWIELTAKRAVQKLGGPKTRKYYEVGWGIPHMIVTEYVSNGSLDNFLKQNDSMLTDLQMIGMARGIASGMKYLSGMNFLHRDLAARNILVSDTLVCKVADFGLSRELENTDSSMGEYCTTGGKIPVRWTAPEAIKYRKFSTASDVWSYGIVLWEIFSFSERPYWDWDNFKVMERVDEGFRLPAPKNCPKSIHELMLRCWEKERSHRPQFPDIVALLDEWIRSPEVIRDDKQNYRNSLPPNMQKEHLTSVKEWLDNIKMSSYMPHFTTAGYQNLYELAGLMDNDLKNMGITLVGHRNKMLRTIRSLPITDEQLLKNSWKREKSMRV